MQRQGKAHGQESESSHGELLLIRRRRSRFRKPGERRRLRHKVNHLQDHKRHEKPQRERIRDPIALDRQRLDQRRQRAKTEHARPKVSSALRSGNILVEPGARCGDAHGRSEWQAVGKGQVEDVIDQAERVGELEGGREPQEWRILDTAADLARGLQYAVEREGHDSAGRRGGRHGEFPFPNELGTGVWGVNPEFARKLQPGSISENAPIAPHHADVMMQRMQPVMFTGPGLCKDDLFSRSERC